MVISDSNVNYHGWAELRHPNVLPFYGVYISQAFLSKGSHGCIGVVTDIGQRLIRRRPA